MPLIHVRRLPLCAISLVFAFFLFTFTAFAQIEIAPQTEKLVKLNVIVTDRTGRVMDDVRKEDLQVIEDGVTQPISYFARDERPITCGFVIDASGSVRRILNYLIEAAKTVAGGMRDGDEGFVASFVDRANFRIKEELTSDREYITDALDDIYVEGGQTAVHDGIDKALQYMEANQSGEAGARRRVLVLITDGEDRDSQMKDQKALLARLQETDVQILVLALTKFSGLQSAANKATGLLNSVADQSGGIAIFPDQASGLPDAAKEIARALQTQYTIGYAGKSARGGRTAQVKWAGANPGKRKVIVRHGGNVK